MIDAYGRSCSGIGVGEKRLARAGTALIDVVFAALVIAVGVLAASGLLIQAARLSRQASEGRLVSAQLEEVADSLMWASAIGSGSRTFPDGLVRWTGAGAQIHLEGWGADTLGPRTLDLWAPAWRPAPSGTGP